MRYYRDVLARTVLVLICVACLMGAALAQEKVELTWYIMRNVEELPFWQEMADRHMEKNPHVKVTLMNEVSGGVAKLTTMIASGIPPDVVRGETNWMPEHAASGCFVNLNPYITRDRAELKLQEFPQAVMDAFKLDGQQYAMPIVVSALVFNYNIPRLQEAGVPPPQPGWNWDDFLTVLRRLTKEEADGRITQYGVSMDRALNRVQTFLLQNGTDLFDRGYRTVLIDRPESVEALDYVQSLVNQHRVASWGGNSDFTSGRSAAQLTGPWRRGVHNVLPDLDWDIAPLPQGKKAASSLYAGGIAILADSRHHEESWQLVKYLTSTEAQQIWAKNGQSCPARLPVAYSSSFLRAGAPENARYYVDAINTGHPEPSFPGWADVNSALSSALAPVFAGTLPARVGAEQAKAVAQPILDEINKAMSR
ncbi:MAG: sugar ABC transporter substrate-binding protein [Firmicutes bacterium]|jgi:multiple sugar transport system substrate-binding protein|nr:sugar ABC transporter substrate-binding protein [Bacillota bacterium]